MFDGLVVESPLDAYDVGELPLPAEAPREPAVDLGTSPGPFALMVAGTVDTAGLSDAALLDLVGLVERSITVAHSLRASLIAAYADRLATVDPGTMEEQADLDWHREQLAAVCQTSPHEADVRCRTAIALRDRLPATAAAVRSGSLPWAQAVVLARESDGLDPETSSAVERAVLSDPRATSVRQVRDATRLAVEQLRPAMADDRVRDAYAMRAVEFWPHHEDGYTDLHARLTTDAAITVAAALEPFAQRGGPDDDRTAEQRRADALVALALGEPPAAAYAGDGGGETNRAEEPDGPDTTPTRRRPPVSLALLARLDPTKPLSGGLFAGLLAGGHLGNAPIPPETLRRLTCEASVAAAAVSPDGTVGPETTRRRFPDAAMRRRLEARDQRCSFPGCPVTARRCHAHHIRHWSRHGLTTDQNMIMVCHRHHNAVHEGGWTLRGTATNLTWQDPHGRTYTAPVAAATIPPWQHDPPDWNPDPQPWTGASAGQNGPPPRERELSRVELANPEPPDPKPPKPPKPKISFPGPGAPEPRRPKLDSWLPPLRRSVEPSCPSPLGDDPDKPPF